jgi:ribokinase
MNIPVGMDTAWLPVFNVPEQIRLYLPRLSLCILGADEAGFLTGKDSPEAAALAIVESGARQVALKLGRQGCILADASGVRAVPPFQTEAVDATGAGDAFSAGLIFGIVKEMRLPAAGLLANALGSLAVEVWGAGVKLPGKEDAIRLLEKNLNTATGTLKDWIGETLHGIRN